MTWLSLKMKQKHDLSTLYKIVKACCISGMSGAFLFSQKLYPTHICNTCRHSAVNTLDPRAYLKRKTFFLDLKKRCGNKTTFRRSNPAARGVYLLGFLDTSHTRVTTYNPLRGFQVPISCWKVLAFVSRSFSLPD